MWFAVSCFPISRYGMDREKRTVPSFHCLSADLRAGDLDCSSGSANVSSLSSSFLSSSSSSSAAAASSSEESPGSGDDHSAWMSRAGCHQSYDDVVIDRLRREATHYLDSRDIVVVREAKVTRRVSCVPEGHRRVSCAQGQVSRSQSYRNQGHRDRCAPCISPEGQKVTRSQSYRGKNQHDCRVPCVWPEGQVTQGVSCGCVQRTQDRYGYDAPDGQVTHQRAGYRCVRFSPSSRDGRVTQDRGCRTVKYLYTPPPREFCRPPALQSSSSSSSSTMHSPASSAIQHPQSQRSHPHLVKAAPSDHNMHCKQWHQVCKPLSISLLF